MAIIYRNITGPVSDAQGDLIVEGELVAKLLRPLVDSLIFISPEELRVDIVNGQFTLVLAAPAIYDFQVLDEYGETWWNFQAPLDNDSPADISLAELFIASGGYVQQVFDNPITTFLGLIDTPESYAGMGNYRVEVNTLATGLDFIAPTALTSVEYIQFDIAPPPQTHVEGRLHWNDVDRTLEVGMMGESRQQVGQEIYLPPALNNTGTDITNGQVIYISGAQGERVTIGLADATDRLHSRATVGIATQDIADNSSGLVTTKGLVRDINTAAIAEGAAVFLSTTPGVFQSFPPPTTPDSTVFLGVVIRSHATEGSIWVNPICTDNIEDLSNVIVTAIADGDHLAWNASSSRWENYQHGIGELYEDNDAGSDITMPLASTYYGWVTATEGTTEGVTADVGGVTADSLSPDATGRYEARAMVSFSGSVSITVTGCVHVNGAPQANIKFDRKLGATGDVGSAALSGVLDLTAGDLIDLRFSNDGANKTINIYRCNLLIHRV